MKIWFDVLTPKQILFFDPMIKQLQKNNKVLCTTRNYREVNALAKLLRMKLVVIGKHGGQSNPDKLNASIGRMLSLSKQIQKFGPDLLISFCSPEASRIAFGLGIRHFAFSDSPHAEAVMRLSIPLIQKLLIPWIIPKNKFSKYGISEKNIIQYKAIDASVIVRHNRMNKDHAKRQKSILIRMEEDHASYLVRRQNQTVEIIKKIVSRFPNKHVLVLPRYRSQIVSFRNVGYKIEILNTTLGKDLMQNVDVFIGSGGTMTAEAALLGIPTISYNAAPNLIQDYLVRKRLVILETNPEKIVLLIEKILSTNNNTLQENARRILSSMEDPYKKLVALIKTE